MCKSWKTWLLGGTVGLLALVGLVVAQSTKHPVSERYEFRNGLYATQDATETIAAGATITIDRCGVVKNITAAGAVTTGTTNTFTAATTLPNGCQVLVCNVGATNAVTLDKNVLFLSQGGADVALLGNSCLMILGNGALWRQTTAQQTST
jgi:hypothetical protein